MYDVECRGDDTGAEASAVVVMDQAGHARRVNVVERTVTRVIRRCARTALNRITANELCGHRVVIAGTEIHEPGLAITILAGIPERCCRRARVPAHRRPRRGETPVRIERERRTDLARRVGQNPGGT